jgi:carotenoid cleavage dioxygenase
MMHDFAMGAEHIVFMDLPLVFRFDIARNSPRDMPYRWSDDYDARLGVLRRDDPYSPIRWFDIDSCYVFHVLNAFDRTTDGQLIVL